MDGDGDAGDNGGQGDPANPAEHGGEAIRTEGLSKRFGAVRALVEVDLRVARGEVYGFLGPNGSGKTTMIRTILDEIRPTAGRAWILGRDCRRQAVEISRHIGYVPGDLALYPNLTGGDTLKFFANLRGGVDWAYVDELVQRLGADLSRKVGDLSSGNRQKIGLIQAFMNRPELLIMDEPSTGLDPLVQREFQAMVGEVAAEGRSVFLSSHTLSEVQRVADRVGIIRDGRLVAVEKLDELRAKAMRRVELELESDATADGEAEATVETDVFEAVDGVSDVSVEDHRVMLSFNGRTADLVAAVADRYGVIDINTHEADLEEVFLAFYRDDATGTVAPRERERSEA